MADELPPIFGRNPVKRVLQQRTSQAHPGLLFDKYLPIWERTESGWSVTDDAVNRARPYLVPNLDILNEMHERLDSILYAQKGEESRSARAEWSTISRLAVGLGADHALENGFSIDFTCGVPVLPGSSLKGLCRAWANLAGLDPNLIRRLFGNDLGDEVPCVGDLIFLPAYPKAIRGQNSFWESDLLNPHLPGYYRAGQAGQRIEAVPTDNPVPVQFFTVPAGVPFVFRLLGRPGSPSNTAENGLSILASALSDLGIGAKTAVGYGNFRTERKARPQPALRLLYLNADLAPDERAVEQRLLGEEASEPGDSADRPEIHRFWLADKPFLERFPTQGPPRPIDWPDLDNRVRRLAANAFAWNPGVRPVRTVVHGQSPLQAFFLLGHLWGPWRGAIDVLNKGPYGWDLISAEGVETVDAAYFQAPIGLPDTQEGRRGLVALYVAVDHGEPDWDTLEASIHSEALVGKISLAADRPLRRADGFAAARQLKELLSLIPARFPRQQGIAVCIKGPAALALLAGRAVNRNLYRQILVPYFSSGRYVPGLVIR